MNNAETESPIFIAGTGRSGTTIISQVLNLHPEIFSTCAELKLIVEPYGLISLADKLGNDWGQTESHIAIMQFKYFTEQLYERGFIHPILKFLSRFPLFKNPAWFLKKFPNIRYSAHGVANRFGKSHFQEGIQHLLDKLIHHVDKSKPIDTCGVWYPFYVTNKFKRSELIFIFREFLQELYRNPLKIHNKIRWCDDTPSNLLRAKFLLELYPNMKMIHMIRDPRDVIASYATRGWASNQISINTHLIKNHINSWLDIRPHLPAENLLEVRLEDLINKPKDTLVEICKFINVKFTPELLNLDLTHGHIGRFQDELDKHQIRQIETLLKIWMNEKGYFCYPL